MSHPYPVASDVGQTWAGTHTFRAQAVVRPVDAVETAEVVVREKRVRALGTRHSFNDIADTDGTLLTLVDLAPEPLIDASAGTVSVAAGTQFGVLARHLESEGYALHNLGSLPHISVAGACATGTHGSGDTNGNLSSAVVSLQVVNGRGQIVHVSRNDPDFGGAVIALGALGVITNLTLEIQPSYRMKQEVFLDLPWDRVYADFDAITASGYSVSLFTNWLDNGISQVWIKTRLDDLGRSLPSDCFGATPAGSKVMSPADEGHDNTTEQGGVPGPWSERLPHFRADTTPSNGNEIQAEYFVDRRHAVAALRAVRTLAVEITPHLLVSEIRTVAADDLWLSPTHGRDSVGIHFTWRNHPAAVRNLLPRIEQTLKPFNPRPHWGKWFVMGADELRPKYARWDDFHNLAEEWDPARKFRNDYLARVLALPS